VKRGDSFVKTTVDGFGRPIAIVNSLGGEQGLEYDAEGRLVFRGYKTASQATCPYTPENRLAIATLGSTTTRFTYDADDWRLKKGSRQR
jgi:YD repeat-containing protein